MNFKVGDRVRITQSNWDFDVGNTAEVIEVDESDELYPICVAGNIWLENGTFEPIDDDISNASMELMKFAKIANLNNIKITVEFNDGNVLTFDGSKLYEFQSR